MGAWGIRGSECDTGLDLRNDLYEYVIEGNDVDLNSVIDYLIEEEYLSDDTSDWDTINDESVLSLSELVIEYLETGKIVLDIIDEDDNELEETIRELKYTKDDIGYLVTALKDLLNPKDETHELYELWEDTDDFEDWLDYVNELLDSLKKI